MRMLSLPALACVAIVAALGCAGPGEELNVLEFAAPSSRYRPAPFWSWNDRLADDELRRQVRQFKAAGYGGFFMHSRVGLETEYLSDEWFRKIDVCVAEARGAGLHAWLYDEDKWPSGFAGGWVNRRYPETRGVSLVAEEIKPDAVGQALADSSRCLLSERMTAARPFMCAVSRRARACRKASLPFASARRPSATRTGTTARRTSTC